MKKDSKIEVCDNCLRASCYQGYFYCDDFRNAGTTFKTKTHLNTLKLEHSDYWT